jgi:tetratricopeptide (TPR) repeat protein
MGGLGKTQLAVECAYRYGQFFAGGVFWCSFADPEGVPAEVAACGSGTHLGLHPDYERLTLGDQVRLVRTAWSEPMPRLVIFDNCEDPELFAAWAPAIGGCRLIVTSRRSAWPARLGIHLLPLTTLPRKRSIDLLRMHRADMASDAPALNALAAEVDDLPLALHLAGRYLALHGATLSPEAYLDHIRTGASRAFIDVKHPSFQGAGISPTGHVQHVVRTFAVSYGQLASADLVAVCARALAMRAACLAPGELIDPALLAATVPPDAQGRENVAEALDRLIDLGLLERTGGHGAVMVRMHRLIAACLHALANMTEARADVERALLYQARALNAQCDQPALLRLQSHLRAVTDRALDDAHECAADLSYELSRHLGEIEQYAAATHYNQCSLKLREHLLGADHNVIADNLHYMGELLDWQGDYRGARPFHERGLTVRLSTLGVEHPATATSWLHVGEIAHALCDYAAAQTAYERALAFNITMHGAESPAAAELHNDLGLLFNAMGLFEAARIHAERAVAIWEAQETPNQSRQAMALNNLGYLLRAQGEYQPARLYLERALALREAVYGPYNTFLGVTLNHLGRIAHYLGELERAADCLGKALTIFEQAIGREHPITASTVSNLGMLALDSGDWAGAHHRLEEALEIHRRCCGEQHRHTARSLNRLGLYAATTSDVPAAEHWFGAAAAIREKILGVAHHDTANTHSHQAMIALARGDLAQARRLLGTALHSHQERLGDNHPYTLRTQLRMGQLLQAEGRAAEAQALCDAAYMGYLARFGAQHPFTLQARQLGGSNSRFGKAPG